uniref:Run domain Beclin-1 interacting and cystein-rich containing protein n=1 Tax=Loa loa TaxID=7209 RepID=A0A1I7VI37_LOALO
MGIIRRHNTMDVTYNECARYATIAKGISSLKKGGTNHRRHHSEPVYRSGTLSQYFSSSEEALELCLNDDAVDDGQIGGSWDDAKRFLIESRKQDLEISRDMERENMHLYLSEMLIAAMEQMQWRAIVESQQNFIARAKNVRTSSCPTLAVSSSESVYDGSSEQIEEKNIAGSSVFCASAEDLRFSEDKKRSSRNNEADDDNICENSAEAVASSLFKQFSMAYKPRSAADIQWLVSYAQAPQKLLPMPDSIAVFFDEVGSDGRPIFFRGSENWAPPRKQWIFRLHPEFQSVRKLLEQQQYRCGGCGIKVAKVYCRRMRYCDYYGRVFCQRCHQGARSRIPARIVYQWNFKEYPVSDVAHRFLLDNRRQPVINASAIDSRFYNRVRRLKKIREVRIKLVHIWSYIRLCNIAKETITKYGNLYGTFSTVPNYMLSDADVYSVEDLENVRKGELFRIIAPLVQYGQYHIEGCQHCRAQAFVCELCDRKDDLLFPFQVEYVNRCEECGSLSHKKCAARRQKDEKPCPKCLRIEQNLERHRCYSEWSLVPTEQQDSTTPSLDD